MPEPGFSEGQTSSIKAFMKAGGPSTLVGMESQKASSPEPMKMENKPKETILPEPIQGTAYGSARKDWEKQIEEGNIPQSVIARADVLNLNAATPELTEAEIRELYYQRNEGGPMPEVEIAISGDLGIVTDAVHTVCGEYENDDFLLQQESPYGPIQHTITILGRRMNVLGITNAELNRLGWATIDNNGYGDPINDRRGYFLSLKTVAIEKGNSKYEVKLPYYGREEKEKEKMWERMYALRGMLFARKSIKEESVFREEKEAFQKAKV